MLNKYCQGLGNCQNWECSNVATIMCIICRQSYCCEDCQVMNCPSHNRTTFKIKPLLIPSENIRAKMQSSFTEIITNPSVMKEQPDTAVKTIDGKINEESPFAVKSFSATATSCAASPIRFGNKAALVDLPPEVKIATTPTDGGNDIEDSEEFLMSLLSFNSPEKKASSYPSQRKCPRNNVGSCPLDKASYHFGKGEAQLLKRIYGSADPDGFNRMDAKMVEPEDNWKIPFRPMFFKPFPFQVQHIDKKDSSIVWIIEDRRMEHLKLLQDHLQEYLTEEIEPRHDDHVAKGMLFIGVDDNNQAHRVEVIEGSLQTQTVVARLIDCGKKIIFDFDHLYKASKQAAEVHAYAFPVKIEKKYGLIKPGAKVYMRLFNIDEMRGAKAKGFGTRIDAKVQFEPLYKLLGLVNLNEGEVKLLKVSKSGRNALVQCSFVFKKISDDLDQAMEDSDLKTNLTETNETFLVAAHVGGKWRRAVIIDSTPDGVISLVYCIDEGCLKISDTFKCLTDELAQLPSSSIVIELKRTKVQLDECMINNETFRFEILQDTTSKILLYCKEERFSEIYVHSYFDCEKICHEVASEEIIPSGSYVIATMISRAKVCINLADAKKYPCLFKVLVPKCKKFSIGGSSTDDIVLVKTNAAGEGGEVNYFRGKIISNSSQNQTYDIRDVDTQIMHYEVHADSLLEACAFIRYMPIHALVLDLAMPYEADPTGSAILSRLYEHIEEKTSFIIEYSGNSITLENITNIIDVKESPKELTPLGKLEEAEKEKKSLRLAATMSEFEVIEETSDATLIAENENGNDEWNGSDGNPELISSQQESGEDAEEFYRALRSTSPDLPQAEKKDSVDTENSMEPAATSTSTSHDFPRFTIKDAELKKIPTGLNLDLVMLDHSRLPNHGYISCTMLENQVALDEFRDNLENVKRYGEQRILNGDPEDNFLPEVNELCVVFLKEDKCWYRAQCLRRDQNDDLCIVKFLDFGNLQKVQRSEILPITKDLLFPFYANTCFINGYQVGKPNPGINSFIKKQGRCLIKCSQVGVLPGKLCFSITLDM